VGGIGPCLVLWRGTCPGWHSPIKGDLGSTQILTQHCGAQSQTVSQIECSRTTLTSKSTQLSPSGLWKHLRMVSMCILCHIMTTRTKIWGFNKSLAQNQVVQMNLTLCLSFYLRCSLRGLHGGHHRGNPSRNRGGFSPIIGGRHATEY
jgi:hypothetical protein